MTPRWLWLGTVVNAILFLPAAYMAASAVNILRGNDLSGTAVALVGLFFALPMFCIAVPFAAWRSVARGRSSAHTTALLLAPLVYAAFLIALLLNY